MNKPIVLDETVKKFGEELVNAIKENASAGPLRGISKIEKAFREGLTDTYEISYTDGTVSYFKIENGKTPDIKIGTVEMTQPGQAATVTITGTAEEPIFNFKIPKGESAEKTDIELDLTLTISGQAADAKATGDAIAAASKRVHILHYDETNVTENGKTVSFDYVLSLVSDVNSVVILYDKDGMPFYYSSKNNSAVYFRRMAPGAIGSVSVANSGIYRLTQTYEQILNKASEITDSNKNNEEKYPTIKAVVDYVQSVLNGK